jgi:hypothetical protein
MKLQRLQPSERNAVHSCSAWSARVLHSSVRAPASRFRGGLDIKPFSVMKPRPPHSDLSFVPEQCRLTRRYSGPVRHKVLGRWRDAPLLEQLVRLGVLIVRRLAAELGS